MKDAFFSPSWLNKPMGSTFRFSNQGFSDHDTRLTPPILTWNKRLVPGASWSKMLPYAGRYVYYCSLHRPEMDGAIGIPMRTAPATGSTSTVFSVRTATVDAPSGYVYDIQVRRDAGDWQPWKSGVKNDLYTFKPARNGTYYFRSRLRDLSPSRAIGFSPGARIVVG